MGFEVSTLDLLSVFEDIANRLVGGSSDLKLLKVSGLVSEGEHLADGHHVGGECAGLVRADDAGAAESLDRREAPHNSVLGSHPPGSKSKAGGDDGGQTLRDGGDSESDGDLEVVDGSLDPGATVSGVVEVTNVDRPHVNADQSDHLGKLLAELVQLLLQGGLDLLGSHHGFVDLANGGVGASADNDAPGLARGDIGAGEDDVLLVLVDCPGVGHGVAVLDHRDRLTSKD